MRKSKFSFAAVILPAALLLSGSISAASLPQTADSPYQDNLSIQEYLSENPQVVVADKTALNSSSIVIVGGRGETLGVVSQENFAKKDAAGLTVLPEVPAQPAATCNYRNAVFVSNRYTNSVNGCSIWGWDGTAKYNYSWFQDTLAWNSGSSCVQGRGYWQSPSFSTVRWFNAGCGSSGGVSAHIGNRITTAMIRGKAIQLPAIGYVRWV